MPSSPSPTIPIVDFGSWSNGSPKDRERIAQPLTDACRRVGFVYVTNHGVDEALVAEAFRISENLFSLPTEQKMLAPHPPGSEVHRGYSWPGLEKINDDPVSSASADSAAKARMVADVKESYEIGSETFSAQPNVWLPEHILPGFRPFMMDFYWRCAGVAAELLAALALGLGLDPEREAPRFLTSHTGLNYQLRLLHYPPVEAATLAEGKAARMPAHTDWGSVTMLFQKDSGLGGLQVEDPGCEGAFVDALPVKGALVLNVGDSLMRWSNNYLKSTLHRVTLPPQARRDDEQSTNDSVSSHSAADKPSVISSRYSIPFFVSPDPDAVVECFPSYTSPENPARYPPMVFEDYRRMRAAMHYSDTPTEMQTS